MASKSLLNKIERKKRKILERMHLKEKVELLVSTEPSRFLVVLNAGLLTGCSLEFLMGVFSKYGEIEDIVLQPQKSYSYVWFRQKSDSMEAMSQVHGSADFQPPLILAYLTEVPHTPDTPCRVIPEGLNLYADFIDEKEEDILRELTQRYLTDSMKHRTVVHFGYEFKYSNNNIDKDKPLDRKIPPICLDIMTRAFERGIIKCMPDQLTVNIYQPGQGIPPHIDTHSAFTDQIASLSLGSDIVMDFAFNEQKYGKLLPRRSLLVMSDKARYTWTHGITPRKNDVISTDNGRLTLLNRDVRISFTFRKILSSLCGCPYPEFCDRNVREPENPVVIEEGIASSLEGRYVHEVYEGIADHFSETRHKPWPRILQFILDMEPNSLLLDVGCGNGKYFGHRSDTYEIGCDRSFELMKICQLRGYQSVGANCLRLPYRTCSVDACLCIAVIHHLATQARRLQAVAEICRVLRVNGKALIYVWAMEQESEGQKSFYLQTGQDKIDSSSSSQLETPLVTLPIHQNRTRFLHQDVFVPWKKKLDTKSEESIYHRYYHLFRENELLSLCDNIRDIRVIKHYFEQGNWCVEIQKVS